MLRRHSNQQSLRAAFAAGVLSAAGIAQVAWVPVTTNVGPAAHCGSAWDSARQRLVTFGGLLGATELAITREWDGAAWSTSAPAVSPAARSRPAMAYDAARGLTVLHGGGQSFFNDTWTWDGVTWTQRNPAQSPPPRFAASMAYDPLRQRVVLFGGFDPTGTDLADVWEWNGNNWIQRFPAAGPIARGAHRMVFDDAQGRMLMCGGYSTPAQQSLADTWAWNGTTWTQLQSLPGTLCDQLLAYDPTRGCVVLVGGLRIQGTTLTDLNDTLEYYGNWQPRVTGGSLPPRNGAAGAFDAGQGRLICSGGTNSTGTPLTDTWRYAPVSPASAIAFGTPCAWSPGPLVQNPTTLPYIGLDFVLRIEQASATALIGMMVFGFSATDWLGVPLPADLASIGAPGCTLLASIDVLATVPLSGGAGQIVWNLPVIPSAVGASFYTQGATLDFGSPNPFLIDMSAGLTCVIGAP